MNLLTSSGSVTSKVLCRIINIGIVNKKEFYFKFISVFLSAFELQVYD